ARLARPAGSGAARRRGRRAGRRPAGPRRPDGRAAPLRRWAGPQPGAGPPAALRGAGAMTRLTPLRWLVRDALRQALASPASWLVPGATGLCVLACLTARFTEAEGLTRVDAALGLVSFDVAG